METALEPTDGGRAEDPWRALSSEAEAAAAQLCTCALCRLPMAVQSPLGHDAVEVEETGAERNQRSRLAPDPPLLLGAESFPTHRRTDILGRRDGARPPGT